MRRLARFLKLMALAGLVSNLAPLAWAAGHAAYRRIAERLARSAERESVLRIAVLPFKTINTEDQAGSETVTERLSTQLAGHRRVRVVERTQLHRVLEEQRLEHSGVVDAKKAKRLGRVMAVDAVVTGSIVRTRKGKAELNARLIHAEDARVLGAAVEVIEPDWVEPLRRKAPEPDRGVLVVPAPSFDLGFKPWWEAGDAAAGVFSRDECGDWEVAVDELQRATLEPKALYWADQLLSPGFSMRSLKRNPGSEIRNLQLRAEFYRRLKSLHRAGVRRPPTKNQMLLVVRAEERVLETLRRCGR